MELKQIVKEAWEAVDAAGVPEHVQAAALQAAISVLAGPRGTPPHGSVKQKDPIVKTDETDSSGGSDEAGTAVNEDEFFKKFAAEADIDEDDLRSVYYFKSGVVRVAGTKNRFGSSEAERNRTVALLTAGHRWYVNSTQATPISEIREAIKAAGWTASRNLAAHLSDVPGTQVTGSGADKGIRVQMGKFDAPFKALVERLTAK